MIIKLRHLSWPTLTIGAYFISRAIVVLVINTVIYSKLPAHQSAPFFQMLFLQSVFVTFISASGFVRSVKLMDDGGDAVGQFGYYLRYCSIAGILSLLAGVILLPPDYLSIGIAPQIAILMLLIVGGIFSTLATVLQGLVILTQGKPKTFGAVALANLISLLCVVLIFIYPSVGMIATIWALSQMFGLLALILFLPAAREILQDSRGNNIPASSNDAPYIAGLANVIFLLAMFAVRENWKFLVNDKDASLVFLILRISEMSLQILFIWISSTPSILKKLEDIFLSRKLTFILIILYLFIMIASSLLGDIEYKLSTSIYSIIYLLIFISIFEVVLFVPKMHSSIMLIILLNSGENKKYLLLCIFSSISAVLCGFLLFDPTILTMQKISLAVALTVTALFNFLPRAYKKRG